MTPDWLLGLNLPREVATAITVAVLAGISFPPYAFLYMLWRGALLGFSSVR